MRHRTLLGLILLLVVVVATAGAASASAATSLADEVAAGEALSARLQTGQLGCTQLSDDDFDHLGEYVMNRMVGSLARHETLNARMTAVMGADSEVRMHVVMGRRYAGCLGTGTAGAGAMGPGMMGEGDWGGVAPLRTMIGPGMWSWMSDGTWQQMSRADWQRLSDQWLGPGMMSAQSDGWTTTDTALVVGAGLIAGALVAAGLAMWRARRGGGSPAPTPPGSSAT